MKALLSSFALGAALLATIPAAGQSTEDAKLEWTVLYVMSYDNNLDHCADPINQGLERGAINDKVAVAVLEDRLGQDGLKRIVYRNKTKTVEKLDSEDITSPEGLKAFLEWGQKSLPAKRYALVFLNHGGRLNQMCVDNYTGNSRRPKWMSAFHAGPVIRGWSAGLKDAKLELLFLQQCGRGSIENLFNFRDCADYVLASQLVVGAPNTYYAATVQGLCKKPAVTGEQLGRTIMELDRHYTTYVLVNGRKLSEFGSKIRPVVKAFTSKDKLNRPENLRQCFDAGDERNDDLKAFLSKLSEANDGAAKKEIEAFTTWMDEELITSHRFRRPRDAQRLGWTGLSTYRCASPRLFSRYAKLPIYTKTPWGSLMTALNKGEASKAPAKPRGRRRSKPVYQRD